ncbi:hypothetical protein PoB_000904700 [Plakobranchus ocellatus]|uniref:Uncharacterized protein n=1 Tax=Plakobranchus ocellatus TaxID=259542 RepID=A0AAV3YJI5_9GAST|nr:hypothetical protein PoB_000904700 [Plakobranchus ocellatus]
MSRKATYAKSRKSTLLGSSEGTELDGSIRHLTFFGNGGNEEKTTEIFKSRKTSETLTVRESDVEEKADNNDGDIVDDEEKDDVYDDSGEDITNR